MKAQGVAPTDLRAPHYYGYAVEFGLLDNHRGVLTRLENELTLRRWLLANQIEPIEVVGYRVVFTEREDADRCFEAFA